MTARHALLGACLALPLLVGGSALAAPPPGLRTITVPSGAVVLILPGAATVGTPPFTAAAALQAGDPMLGLVAEQDAMMRDMMAQMNAVFAQPMFPSMDRMIQAALRGTPLRGQGAATVFTSVANAPGVCSERVTYIDLANGSGPQVTMARSGNGCGSLSVKRPLSVSRPGTPAPIATPAHAPLLWSVSDPPRPIEVGSPRS